MMVIQFERLDNMSKNEKVQLAATNQTHNSQPDFFLIRLFTLSFG